MKSEIERQKKIAESRQGERGAALVMVIMISFLLLVACGALLLESSMNTSNVTDAVAEQQAYYAAESGIQTALNVLRANTSPNESLVVASVNEPSSVAVSPAESSSGKETLAYINPLNWIETRASAAASPTPTTTPNPTLSRIDFRKAVTLATSNKSNDTSNVPRLSRWINYNYTPSGQNNPDRVTVGTGTYDPATGMAFSLSVIDPDNTGTTINYTTSGKIEKTDGTMGTFSTFTSGSNLVTISYVPVSPTTKVVNIPASPGVADTDFGKIKITYLGAANGSVTIAEPMKFEIAVNMTSPYTSTKIIRGLITAGTITNDSVGAVTVLYESQVFSQMGSWVTLKNGTFVNTTPQDTGYKVIPNAPNTNSGETSVTASMTPTEPTRVIVRSTGYGPRGAVKQLETVVQKNFFNGLGAPATLTLIGPKTKTGFPDFSFEPGNSQQVTYSGDDVVSNLVIPSIGTTDDQNLDNVESKVLCGKKCKADIAGFPANITAELPFWLQSTKNLDDTVESLKLVAKSSGRYYAAGETPDGFGNNSTARGITFIDGNADLSGGGGGILVVTGKLTLNGGFDFNGLIIVTGAAGVRRSGTGNGEIHGNMVVVPYDKNNVAGGFLPPQFDTRGGGNSEMRYNSSALADGMLAVSNFVQGVAER